MNFYILTLTLVLLELVSAVDINANDDFYVAGTVEYNPILSSGSMKESVESNLKAYLQFVDEAKSKGVDILVFPEATLNYFGKERKLLLEEAVVIPDASKMVAPCDHSNEYNNILVSLSKAAKDKRLYIVVNMVEKVPCNTDPKICKLPYNTHTDGVSLYNVNIVFDRYGRIISKYRKVNLFIEPAIDKPLSQPLPIFETDFNVKFGHFICFDILFKNPARVLVQENITNIIYTTHWFSSLPFFIATGIQQGFAIANDVNLIAAGGNNPSTGTTGTGIYIGRSGFEQIVFCPAPTRKLYTARVPKSGWSSSHSLSEFSAKTECSSNMLQLGLGEYWADEGPVVFPISDSPQTICAGSDNNICCTFDIKKKERPSPPGRLVYKYALAVNYTAKLYAHTLKVGEITCAVLTCTGASPKTCGRRFKSDQVYHAVEFESIKIKAKVKADSFEDIMIWPTTSTTRLFPFDLSAYSFKSSMPYRENRDIYKDFTVESKRKLPDFLVFGLYGRDFKMDV